MSAMSTPCELLPWDSAFFGFTVARVLGDQLDETLLREIDSWSLAHNVALLYLDARIDDPITIRLARAGAFDLVDVRVVMDAPNPPQQEGSHPVDTRPATAEDLPGMTRIARGRFTDSRFYFDSHIPDERCEALYLRWVEESLRGYADRVFVAENDEICGFVTCHLEERGRTGRLGLLAVDDRSHGRGVGKALVAAAQSWFRSKGAEGATVTTQARNIGGQRLFNNRGFRVSHVSLYYHKWYKSGDAS